MVYSVNNEYDKNNITNCCPDDEMVDIRDLKSLDLLVVWVRLPFGALIIVLMCNMLAKINIFLKYIYSFVHLNLVNIKDTEEPGSAGRKGLLKII